MKNKLTTFALILMICTSGLAHAGKKRELNMLIEDVVQKIVEQDERDKVMFKKHAAIYYLRKDSKHHTEIKKALKESQQSGKVVQVKTDLNTMEIQELVPTKPTH